MPEPAAADDTFLRRLSPARLVLPVLLGLAVVGFLFWRSFTKEGFTAAELGKLLHADWQWLLITLLVLVARDAGYVYRIRHITGEVLSYRQALDVIMIWEFASCVLPSGQGGTGAAPFILHKEGIPLGKALACVMVTALLDNLYYVLMVPVVVVFAYHQFYPTEALQTGFIATLKVAFGVSYFFVTVYAGLMLYAIFVNPRSVRRLLVRLFSLRILRKLQASAYRHGQDLVTASAQLRGSGWGYWARAAGSTAFVWTARYAIIGCLIAAFVPMDVPTFLSIFARNITYKVILLVAITPGGAGIAEGAFPTFFGKFIGTATLTSFLVLLYRVVTFYLYLALGTFFLPRWVARVFGAVPAQATNPPEALS